MRGGWRRVLTGAAVVAGTAVAGAAGVVLGASATVLLSLWLGPDPGNITHPIGTEPLPRPTPTAVDTAPFEERADAIAASWPRPEPLPGGGGPDLLPVQGVDSVEPDATVLTVSVGYGACDADYGAWLRETAELVIVGGWTVSDPAAGPCTEELLTGVRVLGLESELGGRPVVDAVSGAVLPPAR
ncbi:hypothetical protein [Streptomyces harbinensis]|uniref:Uncharacterized protein n=1 Tax=Streptomyces harbinensis TaxID=1176198 RepID=A0A1I6RWK6_9ACTN|nr:hypothetical protein [Streptomyces harbinensis]SFS69084.1 hypothetical protein SAMN05444716_103556 [Streptomyces harbinensis]